MLVNVLNMETNKQTNKMPQFEYPQLHASWGSVYLLRMIIDSFESSRAATKLLLIKVNCLPLLPVTHFLTLHSSKFDEGRYNSA